MATLIENKKVRFNYEIMEEFEAGVELTGSEVKSLRYKKASLEGAYISVRGGEAFLLGATIAPYQPKNIDKSYDKERPRKLLLTKKEIGILSGHEQKRGLTIVPISLYNKGRNLKLRIAVVRGKKKFDKRETIKKRDTERELRRSLKYE